MTRETQVTRKCNKCNLDKRTTVHVEERAVYFCESCETKAGRMVLLAPKGISLEQPSMMKGAIWVGILMLMSFLVGKFMF